MSETPETDMATSHKDPRSIAPLLATIADYARLQESCNAQDVVVAAMSEKVRRLERQRDELAAALREYHESHTAPYPPHSEGAAAQSAWCERISRAEDNAKVLLARIDGEGGEG